jgi:hypothetical protein
MTAVELQMPDEAISVIAEQAAEIVGNKRRFLSNRGGPPLSWTRGG